MLGLTILLLWRTLVEPYVRTSSYGRPPWPSKRELLNAIFYQLRAGSAGQLPPTLSRWRTFYTQFETWRETMHVPGLR